MGWFVYMLRCGDGSLYTGVTDDVERRLAAHQSGKGAKYTRSHLPVTLVYQETAADKSAALRREIAIKRLPRQKKLALIAEKEKTDMAVEMRRKDRQISEEAAWSVVDTCDYAFLAMTTGEGTPYGVPVSIVRDGQNIYFHCAPEGRKADCLRARPQVCVTCVGNAEVLQDEYTVRYTSAMAFGTAEEVTDTAEKERIMHLLCQRHTPDNMAHFQDIVSVLPRTAFWKIAVETITGKAKK